MLRDTNLSISEFPAFQEYILDSGICPVIWSMAKNDLEPYVRASALKCLNQMTQINKIWENCLNQYDMMVSELNTDESMFSHL